MTATADPLERVKEMLRRGENDAAIAELRKIAGAGPLDVPVSELLGSALIHKREWAKALFVTESLVARRPDVARYRKFVLFCLMKLGRYQEVAARGRAMLAEWGEDSDILKTLNVAYFRLGEHAAAIRAGQRSIEMDDDASLSAAPLPLAVPPAPRGKNVVAFSLWGVNPTYTFGAAINAVLARRFFPGWICRVYLDGSVPRSVVDLLAQHGAEIVAAPGLHPGVPGYLWRFLPLSDPSVARFISRDCDSRLCAGDAALVAEWIDSGRAFHVIRSHVTHPMLMLAGAWGAVANIGIDIGALIARHFDGRPSNKYGDDQRFLARMLWPTVRGNCLAHDSHFRLPGVETRPIADPGTLVGKQITDPAAIAAEARALGIPLP